MNPLHAISLRLHFPEFPPPPSPFEVRVMDMLDRERVYYHREVSVTPYGCRFDFLMDAGYFFLECDSKQWHRTPEQLANDRRKDAVAKKMGMRVCRIRWSDLTPETRFWAILDSYENPPVFLNHLFNKLR
jgi:hypothetical protein